MIDLPRLGPPELAAATAIFRRRAPLGVETAAGALVLEPVPEMPEPAAPFRLLLRLGEGRAALETEPGLVEQLLAPALPDLALDALEPELKALIQELALTPLVTAAEAALGRPVRVAAEPPPEPLPFFLAFRLELAGGTWPLRLRLDLRGLEAVTRAFGRAPVVPAPMADLVLPLAIEVGRTRLALAEIERARPGDLVVLAEAPVAQGHLDLVLGGMVAFSGRIEGTSLSYTGEARTRVAEDGAAAAERLDEAEVELIFELGRLTISLGELRGLAPGHVFELGRDLRHPVDVVLGGRKIGEGELVQVGERVGVRLRSLVPR